MKVRNFQDIADKIIKIINEKCTYEEQKMINVIEAIEKIKNSNRYKAPESQYISWQELSILLSQNFTPYNSKWETEIMIIFNDLQGSIEDYWDDNKNELRRSEK